MAIRTSSARDVETLLQQLRSPVALERDAAIARLRVIGPRARDRVLALLGDSTTPSDLRVAALRVIEALDDPAARRAAIAAAGEPDVAVATAAIQVLRPWLARDENTSALEQITALVTDGACHPDVRRAALDALSELPASLTQPLVQSVVAQLSPTPPLEDAATAGEWLASHEAAPLGVLHDLVSRARDLERHAQNAAQRHAWLTLRASAHAVLARRGSRIALYDARDLFEGAEHPLPLDLLVTMRTIGDLSCLEPLARAWETIVDDGWWRDQVKDVAAAIIAREKVNSRNGVMKRVRAKWPEFLR